MRDSLLKVYVDRANFEIANTYGSREITYLSKSDEFEIAPFDFIVIEDVSRRRSIKERKEAFDCNAENASGQILRNCCKISGNHLSYTSILPSFTAEDIALHAVAANLYESIQHIRLGVPEKGTRFGEKFPFDLVERELEIIKLCVCLLEGNINVKAFQKAMEKSSKLTDNYFLESTNAILTEYLWKFKGSEVSETALNHIKSVATQMENIIKNKTGLERIWKLAYKIHNEPKNVWIDGL